jgi:class 3 adenylate cyclase
MERRLFTGSYFTTLRYALILLYAITSEIVSEKESNLRRNCTLYNFYRLNKIAKLLHLEFDRRRAAKKIYAELTDKGYVKIERKDGKEYICLTEKGKENCRNKIEETRTLKRYFMSIPQLHERYIEKGQDQIRIVARGSRPTDFRDEEKLVLDLLERISDWEDPVEVSFSDDSQNYCVCIVNMLESKEITREIANNNRIRKYYFTFINTLATIAKSFDAKVIKNTGNGLMFYFPKTSSSTNTRAFKDILECGLAMIAASRVINMKLHEESLPSVSYRISANYGMVEIAKSGFSQNIMLFGSAVNICSKINSRAPPNGMVIGEDLYQVIKDHSSYFAGYDFKEVSGYVVSSADKEYLYKVYSVESSASSAGIRNS